MKQERISQIQKENVEKPNVKTTITIFEIPSMPSTISSKKTATPILPQKHSDSPPPIQILPPTSLRETVSFSDESDLEITRSTSPNVGKSSQNFPPPTNSQNRNQDWQSQQYFQQISEQSHPPLQKSGSSQNIQHVVSQHQIYRGNSQPPYHTQQHTMNSGNYMNSSSFVNSVTNSSVNPQQQHPYSYQNPNPTQYQPQIFPQQNVGEFYEENYGFHFPVTPTQVPRGQFTTPNPTPQSVDFQHPKEMYIPKYSTQQNPQQQNFQQPNYSQNFSGYPYQ